MYVKVETQRLDWFGSQQDNIRREYLQGLNDAVTAGEQSCAQVGHKIILPSTFVGGPRYMKQKYLDAMCLVQKFGKPDLFITITCNPNWPEIQKNLEEGELAQDRPDLAARVFHAKLEELKILLLKKHIFGKVAAHTYVIEFQKRGLPHAHFLLILDRQYKLFNPSEFDKIVSAEIPDKHTEYHLYKRVVKHMLHGPCGKYNPQNVCMQKKGSCKNLYPKDFCEETISTDNAYPLYRRRDNGRQVKVKKCWLDNRWVVPYNPFLLAKFDCHMNVEICSTVKAVKYIYKYICKGHDRVMFKVGDNESEKLVDEIKQFVSARWISPPEAMWRIFKLNLGELRPFVIHLQLHLENYQPITFSKKQKITDVLQNQSLLKTMLTEFFSMNSVDPTAKKLNCTYTEFPNFFVWLPNKKIWKLRHHGNSIGRIVLAQPIEGERYFLRLLLSIVRCPKSFVDIRTHENIIYSTYREAALAYGLLEENDSQELCMKEASSFQMPYELRRLFATLLVYSCPNDPKKLWLEFKDSMCEDFKKHDDLTELDRIILAFRQINAFLQSMGKDINQYGIVPPTLMTADVVDLTRELRAEQSIVVSSFDLSSHEKFNENQRIAYTSIIKELSSAQPKSFFIDGPGGTGKTFLYRAILAHVRSKGHIALATATSGIAASLLPGGRTAHSRFKIPIDVCSDSSPAYCSVSKRSSLGILIREAKLVLWDEAPMCRKYAIEALDQLLKDLMDSPFPFGGKLVVFGGDFRQTLPVIRQGTKKKTLNSCLTNSHLWKSLHRLELTENMRAKCDPEFTNFLLDIGEGRTGSSDIYPVQLPHSIIVEPTPEKDGLCILLETVFPDFGTDPCLARYMNRAVLTTKNSFADEINDIIINRFPGEPVEYLSFDETFDPQLQAQYKDFINSLTPNGMPPHKLILKLNSPIILLRNLDPTEGLCNGTRLICKRLNKYVIHAEISNGDFLGKNVFIHRIPLQPTDGNIYPVPYKRTQFPIRLCFSMTINKSQGQTLDFVGVYLKEPVFSHGQLYVALSRARNSQSVRVFINPSYHDNTRPTTTTNVVFKEVLNSVSL